MNYATAIKMAMMTPVKFCFRYQNDDGKPKCNMMILHCFLIFWGARHLKTPKTPPRRPKTHQDASKTPPRRLQTSISDDF